MKNDVNFDTSGAGVRSAFVRELRATYRNSDLVKFGIRAVFAMTIAVIFFSIAGSILVQMATTRQRYLVDSFLNVSSDASLAEGYIHGISFLTAALLLACFGLSHARIYIALSMTYAFIWFDDTFRFHERFGLWFSENVTLPVVFGLRLTDIGELAAWGMAGTLLLGVYVWSFRQKHTLNAPSCAAFALCLLVLAAFGAGVDMIRVLVGDDQAGSILALLEDGGEMVAIALSAALAITVTGMIARTHAATE